MKKNLIVLQDGYKECGAASLLSIIRYYKGNISLAKLVEMTNTTREGTNFYQLKQASEQIGLNSIGYKVEKFSSLKGLKRPFICQLIDHSYEHFVVVYELKRDKIIMMDPAIGEKRLSLSSFEKLWTGYILIFEPFKQLLEIKEKNYMNQMIKKVLKKNKSIILTILLLSIIYTIFSCLGSLYFEFTLDFVIESTKTNLFIISFFFSIIILLKIISNFIRNQVFILFSQKLDCSIFLFTFKKILLLPYHYYHNRTTGEIISRLNDLIYVKNFINQLILTVCLDGILLIGSGSLLFLLNKQLFLMIIMISALHIGILLVFRPTLKKYTNISQQNNATLQSYLTELISGIETIKNMNTEFIMNEKLEKIYVKSLNNTFEYQNILNLELLIKDLVSTIGLLLLEMLGFYMVMSKSLSIGYFMTYIFLANSFLTPITNLIELNKEYYYLINSIKRVNHLFEIEEENLSTNTNFDLNGNIQIQNLSFSYNQEKMIFSNFNLQIQKGNKIMILGSSGSGKSTILKLLMKYYEVNYNTIYLNDVDINNCSISNVRNYISLMSQNDILYNDTIFNNITLFQHVDPKKYQEVCKLTCVDEFVKELFLGYQTKLEENGLNLSGGQRQRILLARLLLQEKEIILIDEGLNAIDIQLERKILNNIFSKYPNKTIIIVSHRMENQDLFHQVIHFETKKIKHLLKERLYD